MKIITNRLPSYLIFGLIWLGLLCACNAPAPVIVIVTPTHVATAALPATLIPPTAVPRTALPTTVVPPTKLPPSPIQPTAILPTVAVATPLALVPTALLPSPVPPTLAPPTAIPSTAIPPSITSTFTPFPTHNPNDTPAPTYGAVIGPDYKSPTPMTPTATIPGTIFVPSPIATTPGPSPTRLPILQSSLMGIQIHGSLKDDEWQAMLDRSKKLGMGWIKVQITWKDMQPERDTFSNEYAAMQLRVQRARLQGFKTLISVATTPGWARSSQEEDGPPANPQDLANFLSRLVRDFKPEFIDAIEVWNEPNLSREWNGAPLNGATYLTYFDAAYRAIRLQEQASQPNPAEPNHRITIIVAAPAAAAPNAATSVNDRDWLNQLYAAGLARYGNDIAIGVHPYGWANAPDATCCKPGPGVTGWYETRGFYFKDTLDDYHAILVRNKHTARLWVTEFGWGTYDGLHHSDGTGAGAPSDPGFGWIGLINQQQQADYTLRAFNLVQRPPYVDFMGPMMLWNLNFGTIPRMIDNGREEASFSLLDYNGFGRAVFDALANAPKQ